MLTHEIFWWGDVFLFVFGSASTAPFLCDCLRWHQHPAARHSAHPQKRSSIDLRLSHDDPPITLWRARTKLWLQARPLLDFDSPDHPTASTDDDRLSPSSTAPQAGKARLIFGMCVTMIVLDPAGSCVTRSRSQVAFQVANRLQRLPGHFDVLLPGGDLGLVSLDRLLRQDHIITGDDLASNR
jgi:hypothetical protein